MRVFFSRLWLSAAGLLLLALAGCAKPPPADDPDAVADYNQTNDPLEPTNRIFYSINNAIDTAALKPAAEAYRFAIPEPARNGIHSVLTNLAIPVQFGNDVLEGKPRRAGDTAMRFLINTTIGLVGVFDVAKDLGYPNHDADFGMTLAKWGSGEGPFLFLPILGPTNPRDVVGFAVDQASDPFNWVGQGTAVRALGYTKLALNALDKRERALDAVESIKKTALDPYATFRSLYRQHRESQIEEMENDNRATVPVWFPQPAAAH